MFYLNTKFIYTRYILSKIGYWSYQEGVEEQKKAPAKRNVLQSPNPYSAPLSHRTSQSDHTYIHRRKQSTHPTQSPTQSSTLQINQNLQSNRTLITIIISYIWAGSQTSADVQQQFSDIKNPILDTHRAACFARNTLNPYTVDSRYTGPLGGKAKWHGKSRQGT